MKIVAKSVAVLMIMLAASGAYAGFGIHVGWDMAKIDGATQSFRFSNDDVTTTTNSSLLRDASSNPMCIGIDLTFNMLPLVDLQASLETAFAGYNIRFIPGQVAGQTQGDIVDQDVMYLRVGGDVSAFISPLGFPPVASIAKVFIGGGLSVHLFQPAIGREMLQDNIESADESDIDPKDYINLDPKFGFHIITGVKIKPPVFPIGFRVTAKYYIFTSQEPETPQNFLNIQAGIYFGG